MPAATDPTAVMGKRFGAFVIDAVLLLVVALGIPMALWEHSEITDGFADGEAYCEALKDEEPPWDMDVAALLTTEIAG
jgi:hypothetical protein